MSRPTSEELGFIRYLKWLLDESGESRAAMANLRRGLGKPPGIAHEMDKYVLSQLPPDTSRTQEEACYLVAALFAYWHQGKDKAESLEGEINTDRNLGKSLSKLAMEYTKDGTSMDDAVKRLERRLKALLNANRDDLPEHLRRLTGLLKSKDIPINWAQLLYDVQRWGSESRFVQHAWAKGFWISEKKKTITEPKN